MTDLFDIPRNDPDAALAYAIEHLDAGTFGRDDAAVLGQLQDDPDAYFKAFANKMAERKKDGLAVPPGF